MPKLTSDALRLRMQSIARPSVGHCAMTVLTQLQDHTPQAQVTAIALIFSRLCHAYGLHVGTALEVAANVFTDGERIHPELRTVDTYINKQL